MLSGKSLTCYASLALAGLLGLVAWRLFSPEAMRIKRSPTPVHTHTVTFN